MTQKSKCCKAKAEKSMSANYCREWKQYYCTSCGDYCDLIEVQEPETEDKWPGLILSPYKKGSDNPHEPNKDEVYFSTKPFNRYAPANSWYHVYDDGDKCVIDGVTHWHKLPNQPKRKL